VLGNNGFGAPICGFVRATPAPTPGPVETPPICPPGNPEKCTPAPSVPAEPVSPTDAADGGVLIPVFGVSTLLGLISLGTPWLRAVRRRPTHGVACENPRRVQRGPDADPGRR
jgi:hypothetical protein